MQLHTFSYVEGWMRIGCTKWKGEKQTTSELSQLQVFPQMFGNAQIFVKAVLVKLLSIVQGAKLCSDQLFQKTEIQKIQTIIVLG